MEHLDILQYFQMCPKIVRQGLILSTINQYCPVATCLDIFVLHLEFKSDLDAVKISYSYIVTCKYAIFK